MATSPDARFVFTHASASGSGEFVRVDRATGTTTVLYGPASSGLAMVRGAASDGSMVMLSSDQALSPGDSNGQYDVYALDVATQAFELVSVGTNGASSTSSGDYVDMSDDGRYALFNSTDPSLAPGLTGQQGMAYLRDRVSHTTTRIEAVPGGAAAPLGVTGTGISGDGRYVHYLLHALTTSQPVVLDRVSGVAVIGASFQMISADGLHLYRATQGGDVERVTWSTGTVEVLPKPSWAAVVGLLAVSPDERWVLLGAYRSINDVWPVLVLWDRQTNTFQPAGTPHGRTFRDVVLANDTTMVGIEDHDDGVTGFRMRIYATRPGLSSVHFTPTNVVQYTPTHLGVQTWPGATVVFPPGVAAQWDADHSGVTVVVGAVGRTDPFPVTVLGDGGCTTDAAGWLTVTPAPPPPTYPVPTVTSVTGNRVVHRGEPFQFAVAGQELGAATSVSAGTGVATFTSVAGGGLAVQGIGLDDAEPGYRDLVVTNGPGATATVPDALVVRDAIGEFRPVTPVRVYDTRQTYFGSQGRLGPGEERTIYATNGYQPDGVVAVVLNVTGIEPTSDTFLTLFPPGTGRPLASNLNLLAGETAPNLVTVGTDQAARVTMYNNSGYVDVAVDVVGVYHRDYSLGPERGSVFVPLSPTRLLDTREDFDRPLSTNEYIRLPIAKPGSPVKAAALNVTVTDTKASSYLSVVPAGADPTLSSNLNWTPGVTRPNLVVAPVSADGKVDIYNHTGDVNVIVDLVGLYDDGTLPILEAQLGTRVPTRILDTRAIGTKVSPSAPEVLSLDDLGVIPRTAIGVVMNVTVTEPDGPGFVTVYPSDVAAPVASNLNFTRGQTVANLVVVPVSPEGRVTFGAGVSSTHLVADLVGWFGPANSRPPDLSNELRGRSPFGLPSHWRTTVSQPFALPDYLATGAPASMGIRS